MILAAILFLISGCVTTYWTKANWTQPEFDRDNYACQKDASYTGLYGAEIIVITQEVDLRMYRLCMKAKGWTESSEDNKSSRDNKHSPNLIIDESKSFKNFDLFWRDK